MRASSTALVDAKKEAVEEIAKEILDYFLRHPEAADTLSGIARWRLLEEAVHRNVASTQSALYWLTTQGFLQEVSMKGTESVFCLNRDKRADAERFVHSESRTDPREDAGG